jgi:hypothetical protein
MIQAIGAAEGVLQAGVGAYQAISGNRRLKRLMNQREVYKMPDEVYDAFNLATNNAQTGYSADTMKYLTGQTDRALSSSLGALERMGGDPNDIMNIFDASMQNIMKIGAENDQVQFQKLNSVFAGLQGIAQGKDAEYASREALLKDKMAMEAQKVQAGMQNLQSGLNLGMNALSNMESMDLYKQANKLGGYAQPKTSEGLVRKLGKQALKVPTYDFVNNPLNSTLV